MVKTWESSWLQEFGDRILYIVPTELTDELLPLHMTPKPDKTIRVLVGRLEVLSRTDEATALEAVRSSAKIRSLNYKLTKKQSAMPLPEVVAKFGRMAEPTLARIQKIAGDESIRNEAWLLKQEHFVNKQ